VGDEERVSAIDQRMSEGRFQGAPFTSDARLLLVRESDERLGLGKLIDEHLTDSR